MITFFATKKKRKIIGWFLQNWPNPSADSFQVIAYEDLPLIRSITPGVYIFSDLDRAHGVHFTNILQLTKFLETSFGRGVIINHPEHILLRFNLLERLGRNNLNKFKVFSCTNECGPFRFPVFIRYRNDHNGPLTELLFTRDEYMACVVELCNSKINLDDLMVIEYCDTCSADKLFRKYSSFIIGDKIIPGHMIFTRHWVAKDCDTPIMSEVNEYLSSNPHETELRRIFNMAGVNYGRIDYSLYRGKIQTWEINTNPVLVKKRNDYTALTLPPKLNLVDKLSDAFLHLQNRTCYTANPVEVPKELFQSPLFSLNRYFHKIHL